MSKAKHKGGIGNTGLRESNGRLSYKLKRAQLELQRSMGIKSSHGKRFDEATRSFIDDGLKVQAMLDGDTKEKAVGKLEQQLDRIIRMPVTKGRGETLIKRPNALAAADHCPCA